MRARGTKSWRLAREGRFPASCDICGAEATDLDHCHDTHQIRGVLCRHCNLGLGHFKDQTKLLRSAIDYLLDAREAREDGTSAHLKGVA